MTVPSTPKISITNTDTRQIDNLRIAVSFLIDGKPHFDYEDHGTFNRVVTDGLNAMNGTWNGSYFAGNFLYTKGSQSIQQVRLDIDKALAATDPTVWGAPDDVVPEITIMKEDGRNITGLRVAADFTIDGKPHSDYEDIGNFDRTYGLVLNGMNGTWDGSKYVGNFLRTQYFGVDTEMDPGVLTFLNILLICCLVRSGVVGAIHEELGVRQGGSWSLRQLI